MKCFFCLRRSLRPSRIRWYDWPLFLLLLRPYRCCDCGRRSIGFVWTAFGKSTRQGPIWLPELTAGSVRPPDPNATNGRAVVRPLRESAADDGTLPSPGPITPLEFQKQAG